MDIEELKRIPVTLQTARVTVDRGEHKDSLLDDNNHSNLWAHSCNDIEAKIAFNEKKLSIAGFGLKSAKDDPHEDPTKVKVSYLDEDGAWVEAGEYAVNFGHERGRLLKWKIPACQTTEMKFDLHHDNNCHFQVCQILFYTGEEQVKEIEE